VAIRLGKQLATGTGRYQCGSFYVCLRRRMKCSPTSARDVMFRPVPVASDCTAPSDVILSLRLRRDINWRDTCSARWRRLSRSQPVAHPPAVQRPHGE